MKPEKHPTSNTQRSTPNDASAERERRYNLEERLLRYAVRVIRLADSLHASRSGNILGDQLLRSGTSPMLHHGEVEAAESLRDFIHKLKVCLKELKESRRNLLVIEGVPLADNLAEVRSLSDETEQLVRIFSASIRTSQNRLAAGGNSSRVREESPLDDERIDSALTPPGVPDWMTEIFRAAIDEVEGTEE